MHLLYYPGTKHSARMVIVAHLAGLVDDSIKEFREPFVGSGSVAMSMLGRYPHLGSILSDIDPALASLWRAVRHYPDELVGLIEAFQPSVWAFGEFRSELLALARLPQGSNAIVHTGFQKLAIHYISHHGLGTKAGAPRGGWRQGPCQTAASRWSPDRIIRNVWTAHNRLVRTGSRIVCADFREVLADAPESALVYLDPPYFPNKGIYRFPFTLKDHLDLAEMLQGARYRWLLSYADHPEIRQLYRWATITEISVSYSGRRELLISAADAPTARSI
jgi:DNA adenine methylase